MRKWKDNQISNPFNKVLIVCGIIGMIFLPLDVIVFRTITFQDVFNFGLGLFALWAGKTNGMYKIVRRYAEWKARKFDNKWR